MYIGIFRDYMYIGIIFVCICSYYFCMYIGIIYNIGTTTTIILEHNIGTTTTTTSFSFVLFSIFLMCKDLFTEPRPSIYVLISPY